jgi:hypothetical protein
VKGKVSPAVTGLDGNEVTNIYEEISDKCYHDNIYSFQSDGNGIMDRGKMLCPEDTVTKFKWTLSEDEVMLKIDEQFYILGSPVLTIAKIDDNSMIVTWQYDDGTKRYFYTDTYLSK